MDGFLHKRLKVLISFEEGFLNERVILFGQFVLQNCHLAIERVAVFSQRFILCLQAGHDGPAVCYAHRHFI